MGALAESFGLRQGLKYRGAIKDELLIVLEARSRIPAGLRRPRAGRWYARCPACSADRRRKPKRICAQSLNYGPNSTASHFFLAELLFDDHRAGRSPRRAAEGPRRAARSRLGAGGSGVQGEGDG